MNEGDPNGNPASERKLTNLGQRRRIELFFEVDGQRVPFLSLESKAADALGETLLLVTDIESSAKRLRFFIDLLSSVSETTSGEIAGALFRDAVVQFVECFDFRSQNETELINTHKFCLRTYGLSDEERALMDTLKVMRDGWISHRSGPFRQFTVGVAFHPKNGQFLQVRTEVLKYDALALEFAHPVYSLMTKAAAIARQRFGEAESIVAEQCEKMAAAEVEKLRPTLLAIPLPHEGKVSRKRFRDTARLIPESGEPAEWQQL